MSESFICINKRHYAQDFGFIYRKQFLNTIFIHDSENQKCINKYVHIIPNYHVNDLRLSINLLLIYCEIFLNTYSLKFNDVR